MTSRNNVFGIVNAAQLRLCTSVKKCRRSRLKLEGGVNRLGERCFDGVNVDRRVGGSPVEGQSASRVVQIDSQPTGTGGQGSHVDFVVAIPNVIALIRTNKTPGPVVVLKPAIIRHPTALVRYPNG